MARKYRFVTSELRDADSFTGEIILSGSKEKEILEQLTKVLRVKSGDNVVLIPPNQKSPYFEFHYEVIKAHKKEAVLKFKEKVKNINELQFILGLVLCLPNKPDKLSFILQKAVELGAGRIDLVEGDFSQMKHTLKEERIKKIIKEAAEQSERAFIPEINIYGKLTDYLKLKPHGPENFIVAMERDESADLTGILKGLSGNINVLIGPEGGFSDHEKVFIQNLGVKTFTLGRRILRMETAVILSLGIISLHHHLPEAP